MFDQVVIALSEGAPIISELIFLRVNEYNWDLHTVGKFDLGNLIL
jgi:hypothetical protein